MDDNEKFFILRADACNQGSVETKHISSMENLNIASGEKGFCSCNYQSVYLMNFVIDSLESNIKPEKKSIKLTKEIDVDETGLTHECGVFGAMACGEWPSQVN